MAQQDTPAAGSGQQQEEGTQAVRYVVNSDRSHFLRTVTKSGTDRGMPVDGSTYNLIVWGTENNLFGRSTGTIVFSIGSGSFNLHEHLTQEQARLLARALNLAADHSEDLLAEVAMAERDRQRELEGGAA